MKRFSLPDLGEGLHDAEIVAWHVASGEEVTTGQLLVSVETDKAVVEIPSPVSGRIEKLIGEEGDIVEVGSVLIEFEGAEDEAPPAIVGTIPGPETARAPARTKAGEALNVRAAPAARALAHQLNVDLKRIEGTGPRGTITRADVAATAPSQAATLPPGEPMKGMRRAMSRHMREAHAEVVPATVTVDADVEDWPEDSDAMVRIVRAVAVAAAREPALNCWYNDARQERILCEQVDIGVAVDTADGLIVPVVRDVGHLRAEELATELGRVTAAAQMRELALEDMRGQTITLSNFGAIAGRHAALVVIPPQVAIIGAGRIEPRAVAFRGAPVVRRILPLSLTFDHRAVTGGEATRFLAAMLADLESESKEEIQS